jgi:hypothetical protein
LQTECVHGGFFVAGAQAEVLRTPQARRHALSLALDEVGQFTSRVADARAIRHASFRAA